MIIPIHNYWRYLLLMNTEYFHGRVAIQQRVLPSYRRAFFDRLAEACTGGLSVLAGMPLPSENLATAQGLEKAKYHFTTNHHFAAPGSPFYCCWQEGVAEWLRGWGPDVLIVEANPRCLSTAFAVRWSRRRGVPVIGWGLGIRHGGWLPTALRKQWLAAFLRPFSALLAYSEVGARQYLELGYPSERVFVAPNAMAPRPLNALPERSTECGGHPAVLFVGRLQARKRVGNLIRACGALPESLRPELRIVGDGPVRSELEDLARNVYPRTRFLGAIHGPELERVFLDSDLFVLPGTGGLAVQEAMSYGLPVIAAEADGTQNDLVRVENGWIVPPDDWESLRATLQIALASPKRLREMGRESRRIVEMEVNLDLMVSAFVRVLQSRSGVCPNLS